MNYFHTKKKHYKLSDLKDSTFAVAIFGDNVFFVEFSNLRSMYHWYTSIPNKCCHEVIRTPNRKLVLDIDGECNIEMVIKCVKKILGDDAHVVTYQSHGPLKTSWHLVVANYYFDDHHHCKYIASLLPAKNIDMAVYSSTQFLRMEGSHKNGRIKLRTGCHVLTSYDKFQEGLVSHIDHCKKVAIQIPKPRISPTTTSVDYDTTAFKIRIQKDGITYLDRIKPSYCKLCHRIHENENIAITSTGKLICWRANF